MSTATATPVATGNLTPEQIAELKSLLQQETVEQYPDIIQMVFQTPSLVFDEKKYWLQLLPLMAEEHVERLRTILLTERQKLAEINARYEQGVSALEQAARPSQEELMKKREEIRAKEEAAAHHENADENQLMQQLEEV